jgi:hypothetical protein
MGLGDLVGSVLGGSAGKGDMKEGLALSREAAEQMKRLRVPTVAEQEVSLLSPELVGLLQAEQLGHSELAGVSADPRMRNAQMKALEQLAGLSQTGLGVEDQYAFDQLKKQAAAEGQAQQAAILQNAAAQGTLDSGNALMAQLNAGQQQANRLSQSGAQQAAAAAAARRQALGMYADQANSLSQQDYSQRANAASAKDAIAQFNAQNRQGVNASNLANQQAIANQKAATQNQQQMYNKGLIQQKFQNEYQKAGGTASQLNNLAGQYSAQGQAAAQGQANMVGGLIGGAATLGSGYMGMQGNMALAAAKKGA